MENIAIIITFFYFVLGTIIGSFLNVVSLRYNTGKMFFGRSGCFSCQAHLKWFELIPIFSFIVQLGRCRSCGSKISYQYPIVELLTGIVFAGIFLKFNELFYIFSLQFALNSIYFMVLFSILIVVSVYDMKHKIIPDDLVYAFGTLSLGGIFFDHSTFQLINPPLLHLFAGPIFFVSFFILWYVSKGRWLGLGDAKLLLGFGWILGLQLGTTAIMLSFWIGAIVSVGLIIFPLLYLNKKQFTMKSEVPFGPFLVAGFFLVFFLNFNIFDFIL